MFRRKTHGQIKVLLSILLVSIAVLAAACHHGGESSNESSASKPAAASPGGAFEGTIAMKMESELGKGMEMVYFLKGSRTRIETSVPNLPAASGVMLWDLDGGKLTTLMPATKTYMTMDMKKTAEDLKDATKGMKDAPDETKFPKITPTGKQETIAGYTCEHWLMGDKQEMDMCIAKGLGYFGTGGTAGGGGLGGLRDLAFGPKLLAEAPPEWKKLLEGGAFPLKFTVSEEGKVKMSMEATKIEKKPLDDSIFTIPSDYHEMKYPVMPPPPPPRKP